jgi:hypothetical protein
MKIHSVVPALLAASVVISPLCSAATAVNPASPKIGEPIHVLVGEGEIGYPAVQIRPASGGLYNTFDPLATQVSMTNNKISIVVTLLDNEFGNPSQAMDIVVGQLPMGSYQVEVARRLPDGTPEGTVGTAQFSVGARPANESISDPTDMWWNSAESGWGISLVRHASGVIFGAWFVYGSDNKPIWYVMPSGSWTAPYLFAGPVYRTTGPYFGAGSFNASAVTVTQAGQATIAFSAYDSKVATITSTIDGVTTTKEVRRQGF